MYRQHLQSLPTRRSSDLAAGHVVRADPREQLNDAEQAACDRGRAVAEEHRNRVLLGGEAALGGEGRPACLRERKSTRLNSSHANISYAGVCLKKKSNVNL